MNDGDLVSMVHRLDGRVHYWEFDFYHDVETPLLYSADDDDVEAEDEDKDEDENGNRNEVAGTRTNCWYFG